MSSQTPDDWSIVQREKLRWGEEGSYTGPFYNFNHCLSNVSMATIMDGPTRQLTTKTFPVHPQTRTGDYGD